MKEYLMLIREDIESYRKLTPEEVQKDIEEHVKWVEKLMENGNFKGGNPLSTDGKHLKNNLVTDGPYIELKEGVGGFYFLLANSLEEVTEIAKGCPSMKNGATLELREILHTEE